MTILVVGLPDRRSYSTTPRSLPALASTSVSLGLKRTTLMLSAPHSIVRSAPPAPTAEALALEPRVTSHS
jgi:hypothetical protein